MKFGKKLVTLQHSPWSQYYVDYEHLKQILSKEEGADPESSVAFSVASGSVAQVTEFVFQLDREVEKIVLFLLEQQGQIASQLHHILNEQRRLSSYPDDELHDVSKLPELIHEAALQLLHLIQFVDLNVTGIRKILKKHDKITRRKLSPLYLSSKVRPGRVRASILPPLLQEEGIAALTLTLEQTYWNMAVWHDPPAFPDGTSHAQHHVRSNTAPEFQLAKLKELASSEHSDSIAGRTIMGTPNTSKITDRKQAFTRMQYSPRWQHPAKGITSEASLSPDRNTLSVLLKISTARRRLRQSSDFVTMLAASMMVTGSALEGSENDEDETDESLTADEHDSEMKISNWLNLLSTFLYMTNYYIVAPSSASYAQKLGSDASISGIIIGMTPVAALVSTVLYSWWTSYSYKSALVFASTCSLLGNLMYAMGLPCDSLTYVLVGRLLNGFGSARSINRRYIADTFSKEDRTAASAAFVTAGALGMAAGPAVASALHVTVTNPMNDYWQVENAPGWFMAAAWGIYLVFMILYFEDPVKKNQLPSESKSLSVEMSGESKSSSAPMKGERQPLLLDKNRQSSDDSISETLPLWRKIAVATTFLIYFVLKLVLESSLSSASTVTHFYFGWDSSIAGIYMACLGLLMLPANLGVAYLARQYDDRELMVGMQVIMLAGCLIVLQYSHVYTVAQYIIGSVAIFVGANALEGPSMSLLSKTIPKSWSQGIFNVGFLATEAGTFGRALADVLLAVFGANGLQNLLNNTFGVMTLLSFLTLGITLRSFDCLEPS
jgi:MFS family permease